jgi:putative tricarboxylic transport membrane protein
MSQEYQSSQMGGERLPLAVMLVAIYNLAGAIVCLVTSAFLVNAAFQANGQRILWTLVLAALFLALAGMRIAAGYGLWTAHPWAHKLTLLASAIVVPVQMLLVLYEPSPQNLTICTIETIIALVIVWYLRHPGTIGIFPASAPNDPLRMLDIHPAQFRGGASIVLVGLLFLVASTFVSNPVVPGGMTAIIVAAGIAAATGLLPVRAPQDFYGGLTLVFLATLAIIASAELPGQRGFAFGPGTAPRLFAAVLAVLSAAVAIVGVLSNGPAIEKYKLRGPVFVMIAICLFASIIRPFGLVVSAFAVFMLSLMGSTEIRWVEGTLAAGAMTAFSVFLFAYLLNLPFQLWPQANAPEVLVHQFAEFFRLVFGPLMKFLGLA